MKKNACIVCLMALCINFSCFANGLSDDFFIQDKVAYTSASSLKSALNSKNRKIKNNEYKIWKIRASKNLSENEKRRQIYRLKSENNRLQREVYRLKLSYKKAIS